MLTHAETRRRGEGGIATRVGKDRRDEREKLHRSMSDERFLESIEVDCFRDGVWICDRALGWDAAGNCHMAIIEPGSNGRIYLWDSRGDRIGRGVWVGSRDYQITRWQSGRLTECNSSISGPRA